MEYWQVEANVKAIKEQGGSEDDVLEYLGSIGDVGYSTADIGMQETPGTNPTGELTKQGKGILRRAAEIVPPIAGAGIGGMVGGPAGMYAGAALGRAAVSTAEGKQFLPQKQTFESMAQSIRKDRPKVDPEGSILGDALSEALYTYAGEGVGKYIGKALSPAFSKTKALFTKFMPKNGEDVEAIATTLSAAEKAIPKKMKPAFNEDLAFSYEKIGIDPASTMRVLNRGPKNVLKKEYFDLDSKNPYSIRTSTIKKVSDAGNKVFDNLRAQFKSEIAPILQQNKTPINTSGIAQAFDDNISKIVDQTIARKGDKSIVTYSAKPNVDQPVPKTMEALSKQVDKIRDGATAEELHEFKQLLNETLNKKSTRDNEASFKLLKRMHSETRNAIEETVPGYKDINDRYKYLFDLDDAVGGRFEADKVESLLKTYFSKDKAELRDSVDKFIAHNPTSKEIFEQALDEKAAKSFVNTVKKDSSGWQAGVAVGGPVGGLIGFSVGGPAGAAAGGGIGAVAGGVGGMMSGSSPRQVAKSLLRRESRGTLAPRGELFRKAAGQNIYGQIASPRTYEE